MDQEYVQIKYIDFNIESDIRVNCDDFENSFKCNFKEVKSQDTIKTLKKILNRLKPPKKIYSLDVREKIIFYNADKTKDTLCMNNFIGEIKGKQLLLDSNFLSYFNQIIK